MDTFDVGGQVTFEEKQKGVGNPRESVCFSVNFSLEVKREK